MMNSYNISYDNKPIAGNIKRIRLDVIDSFINEERKLLSERINNLLKEGCSKKKVKKIQKDSLDVLDKELENKRIFQIKLKAILSFRLPESIEFTKKLNEDNVYTCTTSL